ncbi:MAG: lipoprotein [Spiroplasma ixodetis]|nr:lipoprotein [Spiroplasma ixodetis]
MKKLISILGAMTLIGTTSSSVIACGGDKPKPSTISPTPDARTDIENKITSPIALGQLSENTKTDFLAKLQTALARIPNLNTITPNDYNVYKAGTGNVAIQDSDITAGTSLNIKIVAKGNKFKDNKDNITTKYTQKDTRINLRTITQLTGLNITANSTATNNDLWIQILTANEFKNLTYNSYETFMYKTNDPKDTTNIKQLNQEKGDIYIILKISKSEGINCFGDTPRLKVTLDNNSDKTYTIIPNSFNLKNELKKEKLNTDDIDIDMLDGMTKAIIRYMPDTTDLPFLVKEVNLFWLTNNISQIITKKALPYSKSFEKNGIIDKDLILEAINIMNGTKFSNNDLDVLINQDNKNISLIAKSNSHFQGKIDILNKPVDFSDIFYEQNLGKIYFNTDMYEKSTFLHPTSQFGRFATVMEYLGDRNKLAKFYKTEITSALTSAALKIYSLDFPDFGNKTELNFSFSIENIMFESLFKANFLPLPTENNRVFINYEGKQPKNDEEINVKLEESYTENNKNKLFYDIVTKIIDEKFADKYKDILYNEFIVYDFNEQSKTTKITPKPGSKIFTVSSKESERFTEIPYYQLNISW